MLSIYKSELDSLDVRIKKSIGFLNIDETPLEDK
jgi:hypothetical protein